MMADLMPKKNYDLTEITRLLLEMRENCIPKAGDVYEDPNRTEKYDALNAAIVLINNPSMISRWISVKDRLPEETEIVLWFDGGSMEIGHVFRSRGVTFVSTWQDIFNIDEYTHWMPLPEPPKEE